MYIGVVFWCRQYMFGLCAALLLPLPFRFDFIVLMRMSRNKNGLYTHISKSSRAFICLVFTVYAPCLIYRVDSKQSTWGGASIVGVFFKSMKTNLIETNILLILLLLLLLLLFRLLAVQMKLT